MELPHIGQTCVVCNRNDYLPFKCTHCDKIVCIDHKSNHGKDCNLNYTSFVVDIESSSLAESLKGACDFCKKITLKLELVECTQCSGSHCLYHRHQVQHSCPKLSETKQLIRQEAEERSKRQKFALEQLKEKCDIQPVRLPKQPVQTCVNHDPKKQALARRIRVMKIKQFARGPPNILDADKIYFEVKFRHEPNSSISNSGKDGKTLKIYTTPNHTVGRMIDWSAEELNLKNKNHLTGVSQLIFVQQSIVLDSQSRFSQLLDKNLLADGDELTLTYSLEPYTN